MTKSPRIDRHSAATPPRVPLKSRAVIIATVIAAVMMADGSVHYSDRK